MKRRRAVAPTLWDLVEAFFLARSAFAEVYERYESRVLAHARERGVDREDLRLDAESVSKLLDFAKLESLRNGPLHELKDIAHALFRRRTSTDQLDRFASEMFHEMSILKEEQYKVSTFAPEYQKRNELEEYESILEEVHKEFPRKVHNVHDLFEKARRRLESILRRSRDDTVFVRSLALFGEKVLEKAYPEGVSDFYDTIYPGGALEGRLVAARSFARGGFLVQARAEARRAVEAAGGPIPERAKVSPEGWAELGTQASRLAKQLERATPTELVHAFASETPASAADASTEERREDELLPGSADELDDHEPSSFGGRDARPTEQIG